MHCCEAAAGRLTTPVEFADDGVRRPSCSPAEGYPAAPRTGDVIAGLDAAAAVDGVTVFHAGHRARRPTARS